MKKYILTVALATTFCVIGFAQNQEKKINIPLSENAYFIEDKLDTIRNNGIDYEIKYVKRTDGYQIRRVGMMESRSGNEHSAEYVSRAISSQILGGFYDFAGKDMIDKIPFSSISFSTYIASAGEKIQVTRITIHLKEIENSKELNDFFKRVIEYEQYISNEIDTKPYGKEVTNWALHFTVHKKAYLERGNKVGQKRR